MEDRKVQEMFCSFNRKYFCGKLDKVKVNWSKNMTLCAGKTYGRERQGRFSCSISLSEPILSQRPPEDTINTLLHEMIHAYLFLTEGKNYKMGHSPQFREHMTRINKLQGSKITVFHNFRKEVDKFRVHVYRCDGPCTKRRPYFGVLRRAIARPPGPCDKWWAKHSQECGGTFRKVEGPDVTPDTTRNTTQPLRTSTKFSTSAPSPECTPSPTRMDPSESQLSGVRKRLALGRTKDTHGSMLDADRLVEKIKRRHEHTSRSILLPKDKGRRRGPSPERGRLVEGRVNYNYKMRTGLKFDIRKYLERYRAAKNVEKSHNPQASSGAQGLPGAHTSRSKAQASLADETCSGGSGTGGGSLATVPPVVSCWNCGVNVMVPEQVRRPHGGRREESVDGKAKSSSPEKSDDSIIYVPQSQTLLPCPYCDVKVPQEEMKSHLDECLTPFTDDF